MQAISPTDNPLFDAYYADLNAYAAQEQTTRLAFTKLLDAYAKSAGWTLLLEKTLDAGRKRPDGTLQDNFRIPRGHWEAAQLHPEDQVGDGEVDSDAGHSEPGA